ncbi:hypothetical protein EQO05_09270 [Methanosarcina sp. MSH10X1]|nr:hypothetical protein EQO05_09270 [Methanosarcina sp. MSH10X1]
MDAYGPTYFSNLDKPGSLGLKKIRSGEMGRNPQKIFLAWTSITMLISVSVNWQIPRLRKRGIVN